MVHRPTLGSSVHGKANTSHCPAEVTLSAICQRRQHQLFQFAGELDGVLPDVLQMVGRDRLAKQSGTNTFQHGGGVGVRRCDSEPLAGDAASLQPLQ